MGYLLPVSCRYCGGQLDHSASGRPVAGTECSAIARCQECGRGWQVSVLLRPCIDPLSEQRRGRRKVPA